MGIKPESEFALELLKSVMFVCVMMFLVFTFMSL